MSLKRSLDDCEDFMEREPKVLKPDEEIVNKKHSLDSDEEDSDEERKGHYEILQDDDIEGQEDGIAGHDGEVKITPFNMKEELEEGHFDTEGNYHWDKEDVVRDNWLENIDWVQVKENKNYTEKKDELEDSLDSGTNSPFDHLAVYRQVLDHMEPGETVAKTLRRLGGNKALSASERLKRKKAGLSIETGGDPSKVTELTELANRILTKTGNMNVYQESYQHIKNLVESRPGTSSTKYADELDMYADDFDEKEKQRLESKPEDGPSTSNSNGKAEREPEPLESDNLMWEYKLEKDSDTVKGPHTTEQMQKYVDEGFFKPEVWVRKVGQDGPFYSSRRVDFQLYL